MGKSNYIDKKIKPKIGDIFMVPVKEAYFGCGYFLCRNIGLNTDYMVFFKELYKIGEVLDLEKVVNGQKLLIGNTFDSLIKIGRWEVIGNIIPNLADYPFPVFKFGTPPDDAWLISYDEKNRRKASVNEFQFYDYQSNIAPIRYQNALKWYHGELPWDDNFSRLLFDNVIERSKPHIWDRM